ncbi:hypothetical protein SSBG_05191 [Streptomyces sp. SPB074]|nr:hypothetical protein SSBG_05191 [Streptomyces sp. SPB074]
MGEALDVGGLPDPGAVRAAVRRDDGEVEDVHGLRVVLGDGRPGAAVHRPRRVHEGRGPLRRRAGTRQGRGARTVRGALREVPEEGEQGRGDGEPGEQQPARAGPRPVADGGERGGGQEGEEERPGGEGTAQEVGAGALVDGTARAGHGGPDGAGHGRVTRDFLGRKARVRSGSPGRSGS